MKKILAIGEVLVEIVALEKGDGFRSPISLIGPFPSGAPAIFIDQAAKLGQPCALISAVGDDDFGRLNLDRLRADGVDVSGIAVDPRGTTGSAFVRYKEDGSRSFVFNIANSACGTLFSTKETAALLRDAGHLHITGTSLYSASVIGMTLAALRAIKARGGTVSFDPNLRPEISRSPAVNEAFDEVLLNTDLLLASEDELYLFNDVGQPEKAVQELFGKGAGAIVWKRGAKGASYFDADGRLDMPAFKVSEVDPTGAGDCFGAAFVVSWLRGNSPKEALELACAAGALAVTKTGPMEGATGFEKLEAFINGDFPQLRTTSEM